MGEPHAAVMELPRFVAKSGELSFMQTGDHVPFDIDQVSWFVVSGDAGPPCLPAPGTTEAVIVALSGEVRVESGDPGDAASFSLTRPHQRLHLPAGRPWVLRSRSAEAVALVATPLRLDRATSAEPVMNVPSVTTTDARTTTVGDCATIGIPVAQGAEGACPGFRLAPSGDLRVRRIYYLTGLRRQSSRGSHAHRELHQFMVAARGSFKVRIQDGTDKRTIVLDRPDRALHLVPGIWRDLHSFSDDAVCLVMASRPYEEEDYLRHYADFRAFKGQ